VSSLIRNVFPLRENMDVWSENSFNCVGSPALKSSFSLQAEFQCAIVHAIHLKLSTYMAIGALQ